MRACHPVLMGYGYRAILVLAIYYPAYQGDLFILGLMEYLDVRWVLRLRKPIHHQEFVYGAPDSDEIHSWALFSAEISMLIFGLPTLVIKYR